MPMKAVLRRVVLAVVSFLFATSGTAKATERFVPSQYLQIQAAINASNPGDIISVTNSNSYDPITVATRHLLIRATNPIPATIAATNFSGAVTISADSATIRGFHLTGVSGSSTLVLRNNLGNLCPTVEDCLIT